MSNLTKREQDVLEFIKTYAIKNGMLPTHREIGEGVGLSSTSTIFLHMENLEKKGYIIRQNGMRWYRVKGLKYVEEEPSIKCEKCGLEIDSIEVNVFDHEGADFYIKVYFKEYDDKSVVIDVNQNWCGYELEGEEMSETIRCPCCKKYPFKDKEIQVYDLVRVVMFKSQDT